MLTDVTCSYCGMPTQIEVEEGHSEFNDFLVRLKIKSAACRECGEKNEKEWKDQRDKVNAEDEKRRVEYEERERMKVPRTIIGIVGKKYENCTLESFITKSTSQQAALAAAKNFSANPSGFLYLHGKPGVGKTHLSVGIFKDQARTIIPKNHSFDIGPIREYDTFKEADYWTVPDLLLHLRSQIGRDVSEEHAIDFLLKSRLLILDDLGAEKMTDWVRQAFYVVISRRERDELPTVITSNLSLGEIEARVGDERITSRIGGAAKIVRIEGVDERIAGRNRM